MTNETPETWWGRNWKWVVPAGCLVPVLFVLLIAGAAFSLMKHSAAYANALDTARADCAVRQALGTPIEAGWLVSGSVSVNGPSGHAELQQAYEELREGTFIKQR